MQSVTQLDRIRKTPGVLGGEACVRDTRIPVSLLVSLRRQGRTDAQLLQDFPSLTAPDLESAWLYLRDHAEEIERPIREESADCGVATNEANQLAKTNRGRR